MRYPLPLTLGLVVLLLAGFCTADELHLAPRAGVILLNNGELISGTVVDAGDRFDVHLENGEMYIKRSEVAAVCRDVQECYLHKRASMELGRVQDHLELAEWCLRNKLLDSAAEEIAAAREIDNSHPKLRLLDARLALAKESPAPRGAATTSPKANVPAQLDLMTRNLPAGTMEVFVSTIQPMLLNYCARGCHLPRSENGLRLERIHPNRLAGRHPTQRNLASVLSMVDRAKPEDSKLLQAPIRPHGTAKLPIFTDREQSQYRQLVQWVYLVANAREPSPRPSVEERTAPLLQNVPRGGAVEADRGQVSTPEAAEQAPTEAELWRKNFPDQSPTREQQFSNEGEVLQAGYQRVREAIDQRTFVPKDPFDPEIFNRRFFGDAATGAH